MRINVTSVLVDDQDKALKFYTEVLGFVKKQLLPFSPADTRPQRSCRTQVPPPCADSRNATAV